MGLTSMLVLLLTHPIEFRTLVQFSLYHDRNRDITAKQEHPTSGWDRKSMRKCWDFLDLTSRSFSAVIKELEGDLARTICLFYLVLRGLDTIEDDMTIPDAIKQPLLRSFHIHTTTPGWHFDDSGPQEKDRQLLVEYAVVVEEFNRLDPAYRTVILEICEKMETGMADYAHKAATADGGAVYLETVADYDLYCHYVAGLVGEGLSGLWSASGKESAGLAGQLELSNSMGLLLQKTNIIRDVREDADERRFFWPRALWAPYGFASLPELCRAPDSEQNGLWALSAMVVDALRHATDSLDYLRLLHNQSVFNFCAIPATMAMATLALCFMNGEVLRRNVKIRKAEAASLIMRSTNPREVAYIFREFARAIHAKAVPADPNFLRISVACGKIEQWCEHAYPSFIRILQSSTPTTSGAKQVLSETDARTRIVEASQARDRQLALKRRAAEARKNGTAVARPQVETPTAETMPWEVMAYVGAAFLIVICLTVGVIYTILWYVGDA